MTALPPPPRRPLTIEDYVRLDEDGDNRWELQEGAMVMSPRPLARHARALRRLTRQLEDQLSAELELLPEVDVDLGFASPDEPGWVRVPDLVVVDRATYDRVDREGGLVRAAEVRLVVEIVSPGSRRVDNVIKRGEYADAGIAHYWIVDLDAPVSLVACHLAGELGYQDDGGVTGTFEASAPFPVKIELDALV